MSLKHTATACVTFKMALKYSKLREFPCSWVGVVRLSGSIRKRQRKADVYIVSSNNNILPLCAVSPLERSILPLESGCALWGRTTPLQSPLSLTKRVYVDRKPESSGTKWKHFFYQGKEKHCNTHAHAHTHTQASMQFPNPLGNSSQGYSARLSMPLPAFARGDFQRHSLGERGVPRGSRHFC